ncbi:uncharacterized protein LOC119298750 isoform X2 [Triticum dicoccoides]|uniref:uncharacterized protein LOC119298750 isoform X2 n=1 Tax=Triticum dicoccoides TaxID=85692 RepID=UPI00188F12F7|nr:uncharacterized protein LOC119298750 isoform X2 [Triticum dicoccoides]
MIRTGKGGTPAGDSAILPVPRWGRRCPAHRRLSLLDDVSSISRHIAAAAAAAAAATADDDGGAFELMCEKAGRPNVPVVEGSAEPLKDQTEFPLPN